MNLDFSLNESVLLILWSLRILFLQPEVSFRKEIGYKFLRIYLTFRFI